MMNNTKLTFKTRVCLFISSCSFIFVLAIWWKYGPTGNSVVGVKSHWKNVPVETETLLKVGNSNSTSIPVHFITYADGNYASAKARLLREAANTGWFTSVSGFGAEHLPAEFRRKHEAILKLPRGAGYWIWKHVIVSLTADRIQEGEFIVYLDAGCSINPSGEQRFIEYVDMLATSEKGVMGMMDLERHAFPEHVWTTGRIFRHFGVKKDDPIRTSSQYGGGILILRNVPHLRKWLSMMEDALEADPWMFTDRYNKEAKKEDPEFEENRHDQSVSSVSRKLVGAITIPDEANVPLNDGSQKQFPFWASRKRN